jgi:hypothetical protein
LFAILVNEALGARPGCREWAITDYIATGAASDALEAALPAPYRRPGRSDLPSFGSSSCGAQFRVNRHPGRPLTSHRFAGGSNRRCGES